MKAPVVLAFTVILLFTTSAYAQERGIGLDGSNASSNRRIALVIGNGAYATSPLKNPPNDAKDMADALSKVGFTVEHGVDLSQRLMKQMIREFGRKLKEGGQGLFYFAGHGVQLKGRNYLIPVDAVIESEADVEDQGVDVSLVMGLMDEAGNGLNVVILDACRNNPFARSFRSAGNGLAQVDAPTGTLVAYSTAPGKVARDGTGRNGAYTAELLKQMRVPGLPIEEVMKRVRASLKQLTNGEQIPWESSSLVGAFYLNNPAVPGVAATSNVDGASTAPPTGGSNEVASGRAPNAESSASDILARRTREKQKQEELNKLLLQGVKENYLDVVQAALKDGADPMYVLPASENKVPIILWWAVRKAQEIGNNDVVKALLSNGVNPNVLFQICYNVYTVHDFCSVDTKILLIESGVDVNVKVGDSTPKTLTPIEQEVHPRMVGEAAGDPRVIKALIKAGAKMDNYLLKRAIHSKCNLETIRLLIDSGLTLNREDIKSIEKGEWTCQEALPLLKGKR